MSSDHSMALIIVSLVTSRSIKGAQNCVIEPLTVSTLSMEAISLALSVSIREMDGPTLQVSDPYQVSYLGLVNRSGDVQRPFEAGPAMGFTMSIERMN